MHLLATLFFAFVATKGTINAATIPSSQSLTPQLTNNSPANISEYNAFLESWGNDTVGLPQMRPMSNPYRVPRTMISLYFRPTDVTVNPRDALQVTVQALEKMVLVDLQAARGRIPDPKVPAAGVTVRRGSVVIGIMPNPGAPDGLQTAIARQALEGVILYCVEEGWGNRAIEIHHDVQHYVANVVFTQHIGDK